MRNYLKRMEREGVQRVKMFLVITGAYVLFWGPLFFVTLVHHPLIVSPMGYEVSSSRNSAGQCGSTLEKIENEKNKHNAIGMEGGGHLPECNDCPNEMPLH